MHDGILSMMTKKSLIVAVRLNHAYACTVNECANICCIEQIYISQAIYRLLHVLK